MVDVNKRPEGWNKELYDKLSFEYLIECVQDVRIEKWNRAYEKYLRSEWERIFSDEGYDPENIGKLFENFSGFVRPDYSKKDFRKAIQERAIFSNAYIDGANFSGAHLEEIYFWDVHLDGADFSGSHLDGADFSGSHLEKVSFLHAGLDRADFSDSHLEKVSFSHAHLLGADFTTSHFRDTVFLNTQLKGAKFNGSYLEKTNFNLADLEGAEFYTSHLEHAIFYLARLEGARFNRSHIEGADFRYTLVRGTQFIDVIIDDKTDFTGTYLAEILIQPNLRKHLERNIRKLNITNKNVFVAMKFDCPELDSALENAIKPACQECDGLEACTVNEKAGDGWIPQRIREEIQDARFVISDLTYRNPGVYYETGYADGLEIPVIQTCKKSWCDEESVPPLHFDIAQRNTIFWKDDNDLKQQLIQKIKELQANGK